MAEILHRITIQAPPERVYEAITTTEGLRNWWTREASARPEEGSVAVFKFAGGRVVFRMRIDGLEPGRRVVWTCIGDWEEWPGTQVQWELEPDGKGGTVLHFAHRGWASTGKEYPVCNATWGHLMHLLRDYAEGRQVEPPFPG